MTNTNVRWFESPEEYADYLVGVPKHLHSDSPVSFSDPGVEYGTQKLREGDTTRLNEAQKIISQLNIEEIITNTVPILEASVAGYIPNVPAYIAGHPLTMFNRGFVEAPNVQAPLTIYVETTVSAGVSQDELIKRGVAILAFVLAMEVLRPVDLYIALPHSHSKKSGVYCPVIKIASRPMDLGRAVWMLTDPCFARRLFHTAINDLSGTNKICGVGPWAWNSSPMQSDYEQHVRELLNMNPEDIFFKGGYLTDTLMLNNPIQWVQSMIEKHKGV